MKTRAEFLARFEETLAGFGLWGVTIDSVHPEEKTMGHAARAMRVPDRASKLLNAMYNFLAEAEQHAPPVNGQVNQPQTKAKAL